MITKKLHYYNLDGIIQFLVRKKLEIKKKKYLSSFCCHMVSFLLKTAIMQDSGCPYTSMKSGYEIVKKKYTIKFRLQQKISPMKKINELPSKFYLKKSLSESFTILKYFCLSLSLPQTWTKITKFSRKFQPKIQRKILKERVKQKRKITNPLASTICL